MAWTALQRRLAEETGKRGRRATLAAFLRRAWSATLISPGFGGHVVLSHRCGELDHVRPRAVARLRVCCGARLAGGSRPRRQLARAQFLSLRPAIRGQAAAVRLSRRAA